MYLGSHRPRRRDSPWRVLILVTLIIGGLYIVREQLAGASWTRPFDPTPAPTRTSESHFDEGEALYAEGLLDEASRAYEQSVSSDPTDNIALFRMARLMVFQQRTGELLEQYGTRLQDEELGDARTLAVLCMALDWHAVVNTEDLLSTYTELGVIKEERIQSDDWTYSTESMTRELFRAAQMECEQAIRLDSDLPEAYAYLAETLADRGRFDEALATAQTAVELNPNVPDTYRSLAFVYERQGDYQLAVEAYEAAISTHPRLSFLHIAAGKTYRAIGYQLNLEGRWDESEPFFAQAVTAFEQAIQLEPDNAQSLDEIGWTYGHYMGGDRQVKQRGLDYLEAAIDQDPQYALAHRHLGQVYYDLRNYEEAILALEKGIELGGLPPGDAILSQIMLGWSYFGVDNETISEDPCAYALPHFRAAWDILDQLPQRELGYEELTRQGLDACN